MLGLLLLGSSGPRSLYSGVDFSRRDLRWSTIVSRKPLVTQMFELIDWSGTSYFVLAHHAVIFEAALSCLKKGTHGLTLASLNKLADDLGLESPFSVLNVPRPSTKGAQTHKWDEESDDIEP